MKRQQTKLLLYALLPALLFCVSGCFKDSCRHMYTLYRPVYKTLSQVRLDMKGGPATTLKNTGKICVSGNYIFLNEVQAGIHVIDNTNPLQPKNVGFINIPGNVDLAVYGQTLFADSYSDLVTMDISDAKNAKPIKFLNNAFPQNNTIYLGSNTNPDSILIVASWTRKDTTVDCEASLLIPGCAYCQFAVASPSSSAPPTGLTGSMARFAILNTNLYAVSNTDLNIYNINDPLNTSFVNRKTLGSWNIQTIYPFKDKLFIGSNNGMLAYDVSADPANPSLAGQFAHVTACDPVIADDQHAYVTLRNGSSCHGTINELDVLDISNLYNTKLVTTYNMNNPRGIAKDGNLLFVCDGPAGLKVYDATDPSNLKPLGHVNGMETYDIVAQNNRAIVVATDGLYQFDYSKPDNPKLLSKISITN